MSLPPERTMQLQRLLRSTRNRLWLRSAIRRVTTGCYVSAGIAVALLACQLWIAPVPPQTWWFVITLPVLGNLIWALFADQPSDAVTVKFADRWFATQELFTSAQYVKQLPDGQAQSGVFQQICLSAEAAAAQLPNSNSPLPRLTADPRITIALLLVALSGLLTSSNADGTESPEIDSAKTTNAQPDNWLTLAADKPSTMLDPKIPAQQTGSQTSADQSGNTNNDPTTAGRTFTKQQNTETSTSKDHQEQIPIDALAQQEGNLLPVPAMNPPAAKTATVEPRPEDWVGDSQSRSLPGSKALSGNTAGSITKPNSVSQHHAAANPAIDQIERYEMDVRSSQLTAQAVQAKQQDGTLNAVLINNEFTVAANRSAGVPRPQTSELAHQLLGPIARTFSARYSETQQP